MVLLLVAFLVAASVPWSFSRTMMPAYEYGIDDKGLAGTFQQLLSDESEETNSLSTTTTMDPRGMDFNQFKATNKCKANVARSCFDEIDTNRDGFVSDDEVHTYNISSMQRVQGMFDDYLDTSFKNADANDDGFVDAGEGSVFAYKYLKVIPNDSWAQVYNASDVNGDGLLDENEFKQLMQSYYNSDVSLDFYDTPLRDYTSEYSTQY